MNTQPVQFSCFLEDEEATLARGGQLAAVLRPGLYLALSGDLGAGKTTLARGVLRGLGYAGKVKSPTYTLVEVYKLSRLDFYHFDLYRFNDPQEWWGAGFQEHFGESSICLVEWPERAGQLLPRPDMKIALRAERGGRRLDIEAPTEAGKDCLKLLHR